MIKIGVERTWNGRRSGFRLEFWQGRPIRETVYADEWDRRVASAALDLLEQVYHLPRKAVRFVHH